MTPEERAAIIKKLETMLQQHGLTLRELLALLDSREGPQQSFYTEKNAPGVR